MAHSVISRLRCCLPAAVLRQSATRYSLVLTRLSTALGSTVSFVGSACSASNELISDDPQTISPSDEAVQKAITAMKSRERI